MVLQKTRKGYFATEEGKEIKAELERMVADATYTTASSYCSNSLLYPDNRIPFIDKHMLYLVSHPSLDADKYLANLRLATKVR